MTLWCHIGTNQALAYLGPGGVSMFFVLSGFLITGVLLHHQQRNDKIHKGVWRRNFGHLIQFYNDRFVRLYPALLVMVLSTLLFRFYWKHGKFEDQTEKDVLTTLTYMSDVRFLFTNGPTFYPNTWSLAVEEKFYVMWSLVLPFISRMQRTGKAWTIYGLITASLALHFAWYLCNLRYHTILLGRYAPFSHLWKMLLGSSLRILPSPRFLKRSSMAWLGLVLVSLPYFLSYYGGKIDISAWKFPPRNDLSAEIIWEPISAIAAVLIICGSLDGNYLLELDPIRFVGRISYPFYLYQLPLLRITGDKLFGWQHGYPGFATTCVAFLCACMSTFYIEEPLRRKYRDWKERKRASLP